ncbi:MAG: hypothetical protein JWP44_4988 [Mucilaginibacter sp.]|nr:hypothetical protein [Mucilaginibacter sp.]
MKKALFGVIGLSIINVNHYELRYLNHFKGMKENYMHLYLIS